MQPTSTLFIRSLLLTTILLSLALSSSYASESDSLTDAHAHDAYMQKFMKQYSNDYVEYSNGALILYAEPCSFITKTMFVVGTFFSGCGLACLYLDKMSQESIVGATILLGISSLFWAKFLSDVIIKKHHVPYIIFDPFGVLIYGKRSLYWSSVDHLEDSITEKPYSTAYDSGHGIVVTTHTMRSEWLLFVDEFGVNLLAISEDDSFLSISFKQVTALACHYFATYGKKKS